MFWYHFYHQACIGGDAEYWNDLTISLMDIFYAGRHYQVSGDFHEDL